MRMYDIKKIVVLSLFDGIGCGYLSLILAQFRNLIYLSAEIDSAAIKMAGKNIPNYTNLEDVTKLRGIDLWYVQVLIGGSPCQGFSVCGKKKGMRMESIMVTNLDQYLQMLKDGYKFDLNKKKNQSVLFWEFVRLKKEIDDVRQSMGLPPVYFLLENVRMAPFWESIINDALGCTPKKINSKLVIPQNRMRWYWANFEITIPQDQHPKLGEYIEGAVTGVGWSGRKNGGDKYIPTPSKSKHGIANCITTWPPTDSIPGRAYYTKTGNIEDAIPLTIENLEVLQGYPIGYTKVDGVSDDDRRKAIGNGWTIPIIVHIFKCLKAQIEKETPELVSIINSDL
jgi:site-specific DNA-cytosine methylase